MTDSTFKSLCTGDKKLLSGHPLTLCETVVDKYIKGVEITCGKSISASYRQISKGIPDESYSIPHKKGVITMLKEQPDNLNTTIFSILLKPRPELDGKEVAFGRIISGMEGLKELESVKVDEKGLMLPSDTLVIADCGAYPDGIKAIENAE